MIAQHHSKSPEHGTPPHVIGHSRNLMGGIDCDPASSALWNKRVRATVYYTKQRSGLKHRWQGRIFLNPPGDQSGRLVQAFWLHLIELYRAGDVLTATFIGFSMSQFVTLQGIVDDDGVEYPCPLDFPTLIPHRRLHYQEKVNGRRSRRSKNPTHCSFVTWLPPRTVDIATAVAQFSEEFGYLGKIVRPA